MPLIHDMSRSRSFQGQIIKNPQKITFPCNFLPKMHIDVVIMLTIGPVVVYIVFIV